MIKAMLFCPFAALALLAAEPAVKEISPGVLEVGGVSVETRAGRLSFPAVVNMHEGVIEYALVHRDGKVHESILATDIQPQHLHVAALLLGWREATPPAARTNTPPALRGEAIQVRVEFADGTNRTSRAMEELIRNVETGRTLAPGPWVYNGSEIFDGKFIAQREGSIVAIMDDAAALVNNPRPGRENDKIWRVNAKLVPARGTKAVVVFERASAERIAK